MNEVDKNKIAEISKRHNLALVVLFGSRARADAREKSDFDVAYISIQPLELHEENRMAIEFHSLFKTSNVDIVNIRNADPLLLKKITEEGITLYEAKESLFNNLYLYAKRIFRESKVLNDLRHDYVLSQSEQFKKDVTLAR